MADPIPASVGGTAVKIGIGTTAALALVRWVYPYFGRDFQTLRTILTIQNAAKSWMGSGRYVVDLFISSAAKHPYKACVIYQNRIFTYGDIDRMSNKLANFVKQRGLKRGDTVVIVMHNEPAFIVAWIAFAKLGIKCAFMNYNLRTESLIHCLDVSEAKTILLGEGLQLLDAFDEISSQLRDREMKVWSVGNDVSSHSGILSIDADIEGASADPIPFEERREVSEFDTAVYIYTSGTTGLPKAAKISNYRHVLAAFILTFFDIRSDDKVYLTLPLYHGSAFTLGFGNCIRAGATMILSPKFSVHNFWEECLRHDVTVFVYIGEICRYLLSLPQHPNDKKHKVRMAIGNGLRPDVWTKFRERFGISTIGELYAATEAPFWASNHDGKVGAIGKSSPLLKKLIGYELIKCDYETSKPIRNSKGRCIPVKYGEPGLLICQINERSRFDGYSGKKELSEKKLIRNAFKDGDLYFNSGDLLVLDKNYYLYFNDRVGDTFRWKGENVATTEVAHVLASYPGVLEANVYGVKVPEHDGRAGMVALKLENEEQFCRDLPTFYSHITSSLPHYACPRFLRIQEDIVTTGTFKYTKTHLVEDGYDPNVVDEPLYFMDVDRKTFSVLDKNAFQKIMIGKAKL
ncbi:long-chain fatty acid transport protein 6-like [Saccoglossus kowalevskii]|uniref:Long-chain-fatty-acid--CoA ligase n=1 Tax=Saccoglossus kowalevskii TaxID=10224 RepID=A0ABM0GKZ4_SACKO|nr:PREDICTED: long-chain fatty acid transport protein 6-like [Saccoglossus kowalevskii]